MNSRRILYIRSHWDHTPREGNWKASLFIESKVKKKKKEKKNLWLIFPLCHRVPPAPTPSLSQLLGSYWAHWANEFISVGRGSWKPTVQCVSFTSAECLFIAHRILNGIKWNRNQHLPHPYHLPGTALSISHTHPRGQWLRPHWVCTLTASLPEGHLASLKLTFLIFKKGLIILTIVGCYDIKVG